MIEALLVSNLVLWLLVLGLAGVVLALVRQIGVLHERVSPAGALMVRGGPALGEAAPVLELDDWSGRKQTIGGAAPDGRSTLLFFVSPSCPVCKTLLPVLDSIRAAERRWLRVVLASDGARAEHEAFVRAHGLERGPYVLSSELGLRYRVGKLPYAVLIDEAGVVRASGLVNTREHVESLFEAKERGAPSVQEYLAKRKHPRRVA
ncbi:MAG: methylamine dehydrogenase accessory protein MauD [Deltaproteobacteria bacterium]|nr:MAG: methylamine dehydrogenase accessory protein MauD [Deltaproteobacteria bacterium]